MITKTAQTSKIKTRLNTGFIIGTLSLCLVATGLYTGSFLPQAFAQTSTGRSITISPPSLSFTVDPGDRKEGRLGLMNDSSEDILFDVLSYDMIVNDNLGTPEILPAGTIANNKYSASSWIGVDTPTVLVKANSRVDINYYTQIPADAGPGGHYAAIVYRPKRIETAKGSGAAINTQLATLVYYDVAGDIKESATVKRFTAPGLSEYGPVKLTTEITNDGDTHIRPTGTLTVKDMLGKTVVTKELTTANIFPGGISRVIEESVGKKWMFGKYEAKIVATYGRNNNLPLAASVAFWVFPWKIALLIVALIVAAILGFMYMKKNKHTTQRHTDGNTEPTQTPPATPQSS